MSIDTGKCRVIPIIHILQRLGTQLKIKRLDHVQGLRNVCSGSESTLNQIFILRAE
jgi:hypothetical protein